MKKTILILTAAALTCSVANLAMARGISSGSTRTTTMPSTTKPSTSTMSTTTTMPSTSTMPSSSTMTSTSGKTN